MRILHVTPYYRWAWAHGGIPRVVTLLCREQARRGHRVTVCTTDAQGPETRWIGERDHREKPRLRIRVFPNISNRLAYHCQFFVPRSMRAFLAEHAEDFSLAHLHGVHNLPGVWAGRLLRAAGVPYVVAPNGTAPRIEQRRLAKWIFDHSVGRKLLPGARRLLAVSRAEERQFQNLGLDQSRVRTCPNPLDLNEFSELKRGVFRAHHRIAGPLLLYLGRISPRKGVTTLVRAVASMPPHRRPTLVIAGNDAGAGRTVRRAIQRHGLGQQTRLVGLLRGQRRLEALADADAVAYAGEHEIFGLVPLEANLAGTPAVVAHDSGAAEVTRATGGGLQVPPRDPVALAGAVTRLLNEPWTERIEAAQRRIGERYSPEKVCDQLDAIYLEMLNKYR